MVGLANHTVLISRDGSEYPIDDSAAPIRDKSGYATPWLRGVGQTPPGARVARDSAWALSVSVTLTGHPPCPGQSEGGRE